MAGTQVALAAAACHVQRTASAPIPDDVDLVAVVFVRRGATFVSATPLLRLGSDRSIETQLQEGADDEAFVVGYREQTLAPLLPDPSVYTTVALRPRRNQETGLPPPDVAFLAPPDSDEVRTVDPGQLPFELSADWAGQCIDVPVGNRLLIDTDCSASACLAPADAQVACSGQVAVGCRLTTIDYAFDAVGNLSRVQLGGESNGVTCRSRSQGLNYVQAECPQLDCTVEVFTEPEDLGITTRSVQVVDGDFEYGSVLRPPYAGLVRGPIVLSDGTARVVGYLGTRSTRRCPEPQPTELVTLALDGEGTPRVLDRQASQDCLRLLRPAPDGNGWFGAFRDAEARWTWGRFDADGTQVDSVVLTTTSTPTLTPTAAGFVVDRWVIALSDVRSKQQRLQEDGNEDDLRASRILSVDAGATERILGPMDLVLQASDEGPVYDIFPDSQGAVVVTQDQNEVTRLNRFDLQLTRNESRYRIDARVGTEPEPYLSLLTSSSPEEILFISMSGTEYGEEPNVDNEGVLHLVRDRVAVTDRYFFAQPAEPFTLARWPGRPRSVLVGLASLDFGARPNRTPDVRGLLSRFDLDRPGFVAGSHVVGTGPVTGLAVGDDGQVWGVLGLSGQVFSARLP